MYCTPRWDLSCGDHLRTPQWDAHPDIFRNFQPLTSRCDSHRRDCLRGGMHTAEMDSAVGDDIRGGMHNARSSPRWDAHRGDNFVIEYLGEIETKFENTGTCMHYIEQKIIQYFYLKNSAFIFLIYCTIVLLCLSGAQMGSNHEKIGVKILVTHSL